MSDAADALDRCVAEFEIALRSLAVALAHRVVSEELRGRQRDAVRASTRARGAGTTTMPGASGTPRRAARANAARPTRATSATASAAPPVAIQESAATADTGGRKRWTRETVIAELCEWLISGIVEPSFLRRHGKPGLVPAATRIFGRFDSALNVANLHLAKQYPDGPPSRRAGSGPARPPTPRPRAPSDPAASDTAKPTSASNSSASGGNGVHPRAAKHERHGARRHEPADAHRDDHAHARRHDAREPHDAHEPHDKRDARDAHVLTAPHPSAASSTAASPVLDSSTDHSDHRDRSVPA